MKYINKILAILAVSLIAASCEHDAESYTPGEQAPAGCQGVYFATSKYVNVLEVEPETKSFDIVLKRTDKSAAGTVNLSAIKNEENVFVLPATASFAAGEETTSITVTYPTAKEGIKYVLHLAVEGDNVSPYTNGYREAQYEFSILKWEHYGNGYMLDGVICTFYGVNPAFAYNIEVQKTKTASSDRYRFTSPFSRPATAVDELGGYNGFPYRGVEYGPDEYTYVIDVVKGVATLKPMQMGVSFGDGILSTGSSVYLDTSKPSGKLTGDVIVFGEQALYISEPNYNNGAAYLCKTPTTIYLTTEAYKESLKAAK